MKMKKCNFGKFKELCDVHKRGSSSFMMHDHKKVFNLMGIKNGFSVLDLGCGPGDYSIEAAKIVGLSGVVYAMDKNSDLVEDVAARADGENLSNIKTIVGDITERLPFEDGSIDVCMAITVLHIPAISKKMSSLFREIGRVLKLGGDLITIDVKKEDPSFGPPMNMRLSPEDIEMSMYGSCLQKVGLEDLGYNYMLRFRKAG